MREVITLDNAHQVSVNKANPKKIYVCQHSKTNEILVLQKLDGSTESGYTWRSLKSTCYPNIDDQSFGDTLQYGIELANKVYECDNQFEAINLMGTLNKNHYHTPSSCWGWRKVQNRE